VNLTGGMKMDSTMQSASCPPISDRNYNIVKI